MQRERRPCYLYTTHSLFFLTALSKSMCAPRIEEYRNAISNSFPSIQSDGNVPSIHGYGIVIGNKLNSFASDINILLLAQRG
jgi:predicted 2-oxoglutarate/Fe(II)-dependent dioxygenase YbiX